MEKNTYYNMVKKIGTIEEFSRLTGLGIDIIANRIKNGRQVPQSVIETLSYGANTSDRKEQESYVQEALAQRQERETVKELKKQVRFLTNALDESLKANSFKNYVSKSSVNINWKSDKTKTNSTIPVLFSSDFQAGEVIDFEYFGNSNFFNKKIFADRYMSMINQFIDISMQKGSHEGCFYLRGGDCISGGIHGELKDTDDMTNVEAASYVAHLESEGIKKLIDAFGKVFVISIPGNHGRIQNVSGMGNRNKQYVEHNMETIIAELIAAKFTGNDKVNFSIPKDGRAIFDIYNLKFLMTHGDRMPGGSGPKGVSTGHEKEILYYSNKGIHVDQVLSGHYHTSMRLPTGFSNGTLAGFGEYARDLGCRFDYPKQWMFIVEDNKLKGKITFATEIMLG